ncbi:MAG: hypothetical protein ACOH1Y_11525 [Propionicimonas sp.]
MARIRSIKPEAFASETLSLLSLEAERSFMGLLTQVDDKGREKDRPAVLNGALWPLRPTHKPDDMTKDMDEMEAAGKTGDKSGLLCRYEVDSRRYFHFPTFNRHQVINRPSKDKAPPCPKCEGLSAVAATNASITQLPFGDRATG